MALKLIQLLRLRLWISIRAAS